MSDQEAKADSGEEDDEPEGFADSGTKINRKETNRKMFENIQTQLGPDGVKGLQSMIQKH